jgi:hypothetical protein
VPILNPIQDNLLNVFHGLLGVMGQGALSLFFISVMCAITFWLFEIFRAMNNGGGASIITTVAWRIFVIAGVVAFVDAWPVFATGVADDIHAFAQRVANANTLATLDFTPDGVVAVSFQLAAMMYKNGWANPFQVLTVMGIWKLVSIFLIQVSGIVLGAELLLANISLAMVLGGASFLIGFCLNPWLSFFADAIFRLIGACAVFIILIGVFVAAGQSMAAISLASIAGVIAIGNTVSGPDMLLAPLSSLVFAVLAAFVPAAIAGRVAGGSPIATVGMIFSMARGAFR